MSDTKDSIGRRRVRMVQRYRVRIAPIVERFRGVLGVITGGWRRNHVLRSNGIHVYVYIDVEYILHNCGLYLVIVNFC